MLGRDQGQNAIGHPALTDEETGLANRLHFDLVYTYMFAAGNRGLIFTVMLVSVGGPGAVPNERLETIGQKIRATTRDSDLVAHVGRGRYAVLLLGTNLQGARIAADRVEMALATVIDKPVSFGLAVYNDRMQDASEPLEAADKALLAAEAAGGGVEFG